MPRAATEHGAARAHVAALVLALGSCRSIDPTPAPPAPARAAMTARATPAELAPTAPARPSPPDSPSAPRAPAADGWLVLCDGSSLGRFEPTSFGGEGAVELVDGGVRLGMGMMLTGIRLPELGELPTRDYELEVVAARLAGTDFFCGLTFPVGASHATLICGGWGGALTGLSCLDGLDASDNETKSYRRYEKGRDYTIRVRVAAERVQAWIDDEPVLDVSTTGRRVHLRTEVLKSAPLGISSYATTARIRSARWRAL